MNKLNAHKLDLARGYAEFNGKFNIFCTIPIDLKLSSDEKDFMMIRNTMDGSDDSEYLPKKGTREWMEMLAGING